jgi:hypothetical protein
MSLWLLDRREIPRLDHLSIFIQGPLNLKKTYERVIHEVARIRTGSDFLPKLFVLRLPHPLLSNDPLDIHSHGIDDILADTSLPFKIVRPHQAYQGILADLDVGVDVGWRYGTIFLSSQHVSNFHMLRYVVWTPLPRGTSWPYML